MSTSRVLPEDGVTVAQAQQYVRTIADKRGHIDDGYWQELENVSPAARDSIHQSYRNLANMAASPISTLAKNLYTSNGHFVFELLQNAEDNHYKIARAQGRQPYVAFEIYEDRVIIECNEDGFNEANLEAICSVGHSSKTGARPGGYIGEKGIGFKSVFRVAYEVHIQSGPYSFYFRHRSEDSGLGMITPIWEDPVQQIPRHMTRMTLLLHETGDPAVLASQRQTMRRQFEDMQESLLLFMRNLEVIRISFFDSDSVLQASTSFSSSEMNANCTKLTKVVTKGAISKETCQIYHVTRHTVDNLAENENRTYSEFERWTRAYSKAEVILAFPLSEDGKTFLIKPQDVFAFLPMKHMGFSFLIQSDFVTQANRQDIVVTSARNRGILDGISDAFIQAVLEFCSHPELRYTWMGFLPDKDRFIHGQFGGIWSDLVLAIGKKLSEVPSVLPRSNRGLRKISELRILLPSNCDSKGEPLFRDLQPEKWLSENYLPDDIKILEKFGLKKIQYRELLAMVKQDLGSASSRMRSKATDEDWHTRAARLLTAMIQNLDREGLAELRSLGLIPLLDSFGTIIWGSPNSSDNIYLGETEGGFVIPGDLPLKVVEIKSSRNQARVAFFKKIGVYKADPRMVRSKILDQHRSRRYSGSSPFAPSVLDVFKQIEFLFLTNHLKQTSERLKNELALPDQREELWKPGCGEPLYFPDGDLYGPQELLKATEAGVEPGCGAPGMTVRFLHQRFIENEPEKPRAESPEWKVWLKTYAGLRFTLRTFDNSSNKLSDECMYVANHRPERFLGLLRRVYVSDGENSNVWAVLRELGDSFLVLCEGNRMVTLSRTYLPLLDLQQKCGRYLPVGENFAFLIVDDQLTRETYHQMQWSFLTKLIGVKVDEDVDFYLAILSQLCGLAAQDDRLGDRVIRLYHKIYMKYAESAVKELDKAKIQQLFQETSAIHIPTYCGFSPSWALLEECFWEGMPSMITAKPLRACYMKSYNNMSKEMHSVERLFCDVIQLKNCRWFDILSELYELQRCNEVRTDQVFDVYQYLNECLEDMNDEDQKTIMKRFETESIIYVPSDGGCSWHCVRDCLWSSNTNIHEKVTLSEHYQGLERFFCDFLKVKTLSIHTVLHKLACLGSDPESSPADVKDYIISLSSFLGNMETKDYPRKSVLHAAKILPIRHPDGNVSLDSAAADFAIPNTIPLQKIFASRVKTLGFSLNEVKLLGPFIAWLGLERKYMSGMVKEVTTVNDESRQPTRRLERKIRPKAHALYRIAHHCHSTRLQNSSVPLYAMLCNAQVYETDRISRELSLTQDGQVHKHVKEGSDFHIRDDGTQLEIFISRNKKRQDLVYLWELGPRLFDWLVPDASTRVHEALALRGQSAIQKIMTTTGRSRLEQILEDDGIANADIEALSESTESESDDDDEPDDDESYGDEPDGDESDGDESDDAEPDDAEPDDDEPDDAEPDDAEPDNDEPDDDEPDDAEPDGDESDGDEPDDDEPDGDESDGDESDGDESDGDESDDAESDGDEPDDEVLSSPPSPPPNVVSPDGSDRTWVHGDPALRSSRSIRRAVSPYGSHYEDSNLIPQGDPRQDRYRDLLCRIVSAARTAQFPRRNLFDMSGLLSALPLPASSGIGYDDFEEELRLELSSSVERDVKIGAAGELFVFELLKSLSLPNFSMSQWQSKIRHHVKVHPEYASIAPWPHRETADITYDDTEGALTKLLIDNGHLERGIWRDRRPKYYLEVKTTLGLCSTPFYMSQGQYRRMNSHRNDTEAVYIVFRVYEVQKQPIGIRVLVNPAELEAEGKLGFTAEKWSVRVTS